MHKFLLLFFLNIFKTKALLKLENIILRKQIEILQRANPKLQIKRSDWLVFSIMKDLMSTWKDKIFIVKPETVIKWHRSAFSSYWRRKSRKTDGRPRPEREVIDLIRQIANDSPLWGGELKKWKKPKIRRFRAFFIGAERQGISEGPQILQIQLKNALFVKSVTKL